MLLLDGFFFFRLIDDEGRKEHDAGGEVKLCRILDHFTGSS
jgi:hypothetical protein